MLKELKLEQDIEKFGKYKIELIKEHQHFANNLGLYDKVVDKYNINDALRNIGKKDFYQFLIINDEQVVGILEYKIENSNIDDMKIIYIKDIYILKEFRGKGLGKKVLNDLKNLNYRIELECWYGMPANDFYKSLGFKELKTRYFLDNK